MLRLLAVTLALAGLALAQHGKAVRAGGGGPKAQPAPKVRPVSAAPQLTIRPKLAARVQPLLPPGLTADVAAAGFKNRGQFVAAVHVSNNLGIPFDVLKAEMTGPEPKSLGQAIQTLKPEMQEDDVERVSKEARRQAKEMERGL